MPSLKRTAGFGDMEVIGDLDGGQCGGGCQIGVS